MSYTINSSISAKYMGGARAASTIKYIAIHYTANSGTTATAKGNANYFHNCTREASAHYVVDSGSTIYQCVPDLKVAWAVGGAKLSGNGGSLHGICTNSNSISIEMVSCSNASGYYIPDATIAHTVELTKALMAKYNIPISNVVRHYDVTGKLCPATHCNTTQGEANWKAFKAKLGATAVPITNPVVPTYSKDQFVRDLQKAIGVTVDGIAGPKTLAALPTVSATKNNKHAVVKPLQQYLNAIGYNCGTPDGIAGKKFKSAAIKWQKANGCTADGEFTNGGKSWKLITA